MTRSLFRAACLAVTCALAGTSGAAQQKPVAGEIVEGWQQSDGTRIAAIRLTLAPGWKTYWRSPGDAGIPPLFDWSGSGNMADVAITWPTPSVFDQSGMRSIGYKNEVVIPLHVTPKQDGKPVHIRAQMQLGVCSDICIPEELSFDAVLNGTATKPTPVVAAALAARPFSASEAGVQGAVCVLRPTKDGMEITATLTLPHTGGAEVVVIEAGQPGVWVSETDTARRGGVLTAQADMAAGGKALALNRSAIRFTVLGADMAVDIQGCVSG